MLSLPNHKQKGSLYSDYSRNLFHSYFTKLLFMFFNFFCKIPSTVIRLLALFKKGDFRWFNESKNKQINNYHLKQNVYMYFCWTVTKKAKKLIHNSRKYFFFFLESSVRSSFAIPKVFTQTQLNFFSALILILLHILHIRSTAYQSSRLFRCTILYVLEFLGENLIILIKVTQIMLIIRIL